MRHKKQSRGSPLPEYVKKAEKKRKEARDMSKTGPPNSLAAVWSFHHSCFSLWALLHMSLPFHIAPTFSTRTIEDDSDRTQKRKRSDVTSFERKTKLPYYTQSPGFWKMDTDGNQ